MRISKPSYRHFLMALMFFFNAVICFSQTTIKNLQVDYQTEFLGSDDITPHFSWQMEGTPNNRGLMQTAYQIVVADEDENMMWDSKKTSGSVSLGIPYEGKKLQPTTKYTFQITVWDQKDAPITNSSWFETGLLDADPDPDKKMMWAQGY